MKANKTKNAKAKTKKRPAAKAKIHTKAKVKAKTKTRKKKGERTHIIAIIDKSGSMGVVAKDAIGGFNTFLNEQKKLKDKATMNVVLFSDYNQITPLYDDKILDIHDIQELTPVTYVPAGSTALNDAIVQSMTSFKLKENNMKPSKRPNKVLVIIITDGEENASREYPKARVDEVKKLIIKRKEENWQFIFLCSTEETALTGEALGVSRGNVFQFMNTAKGTGDAYQAMSIATSSLRSTSTKSKTYAKVSNNLMVDDETGVDVNAKITPDADVDLDNDLS